MLNENNQVKKSQDLSTAEEDICLLEFKVQQLNSRFDRYREVAKNIGVRRIGRL